MGLGAPELLIVLVIVLVIFGGSKLPKLAKSLGEAQKEFKKGSEEGVAEEAPVATKTVVVEEAPVTKTVVVEKDTTENGPIS